MVTHFPAFAQEEYTIPRYIPTHFVRGSNKTAEISTLTSLLWCRKVHHEALLWRNEMNDTRGVPT